MRKDFNTGNSYQCLQLDAQDWHYYEVLADRIYDEMSAAFEDMSEQPTRAQSLAIARTVFFTPGTVTFGLFKDASMIGYTHLDIDRHHKAKLTGSYILENERGYGDLMYQVRIAYLVEHTGHDDVTTSIWRGNGASRRVAERNGFICLGASIESGPNQLVYSLNLQKIRLSRAMENNEPSSVTPPEPA